MITGGQNYDTNTQTGASPAPDEEGALEKFETYSDGQKKAFIDWINSAKTEQTKADRIAKTIIKVLNEDKFY